MTFGRILVVVLVLGAAAALGAYWIGPGVVPRARLSLLALDAESQFSDDVRLAAPDSAPDGLLRHPLILALSNTGERESSVESISLSAPGWIRFLSADGPVLPLEDLDDGPLRRYVFTLGGEPIEPGALPQVPAGLGRMWVSADVPSITCRLRWDGVPEFVPAPPWDPASLADVSIYYSIEGRRLRHTGVLRLHLDPATLTAAPMSFTAGEPVISRPGATPPPTDSLTLVGERAVTCGAPERRVDLESTVWRTGPDGRGRLIVIRHEGAARRLLIDADGDGRIERESWDGDVDGAFEASRAVSFRTPAWLLPPDTPGPAVSTNAAGDSLNAARAAARADSLARAAAARDTAGTDTIPADSITADTMAVDTMVIDTILIETVGAGAVVPGAARVVPGGSGRGAADQRLEGLPRMM